MAQNHLNFNEGADRLFADVSIQEFRGLSSVQLEELSRVNLIVGGNNVGKTSIIEAIALLADGANISQWSQIARSREVRTGIILGDQLSTIQSIRWLFPSVNDDEPAPILISAYGEKGRRQLFASCKSISGIPSDEDLRRAGYRANSVDRPQEDEGWLIDVNLDDDGVSRHFHGEIDTQFALWSSLGTRNVADRTKSGIPCEFLPPYSHRNSGRTVGSLSSALRRGGGLEITELLSQLDQDVRGVEILSSDDGHRPVVMVRHSRSGLVPINSLGDGVRRALSIAVAVRRARGGVLLIDEIEAAIHVTALRRMYSWLVDACHQYNVQLFATTHSLEAVSAIAESDRNSSVGNSLSAYGVSHFGGEYRSKRYTGGMIYRLVHESGLDIR